MVSFALWEMLFRENVETVIITPIANMTSSAYEKLRFIVANLPDFIKNYAGVDSKAKGIYYARNGSRVVLTSAKTGFFFRSTDNLFFDEAAFSSQTEGIFQAAFPIFIEGQGRFFLSSTAPAKPEFFTELFQDALKGKNSFHASSFPWPVIPERDLAWAKRTKKTLGSRAFHQEYNCILPKAY